MLYNTNKTAKKSRSELLQILLVRHWLTIHIVPDLRKPWWSSKANKGPHPVKRVSMYAKRIEEYYRKYSKIFLLIIVSPDMLFRRLFIASNPKIRNSSGRDLNFDNKLNSIWITKPFVTGPVLILRPNC